MATTETEEQVCSICLVQFSRYTCPKCNIRYCSVSCYKNEKHAQCSETFYRDSFMTELEQHRASDEEKHKMEDILKRLAASEEQRDQDMGPSLEERLAGLDLDSDIERVWDVMTVSERSEFQLMARSGLLSTHLHPRPPWWEVADRLVVPLESEEGVVNTRFPKLPRSLPSLEALTKGKPVSPLLCYNLLNILYGYAYAIRLHGNDHHDLPELAAQSVLDISTCLSLSSSFDTVGDALHVAMTTIKQSKELFNSRSFSAAVLADVRCILCSPKSHDCHVTRALADLHKLLGVALSKLKSAAASDGSSKDTTKLWLARKKIHFFLAWSHFPASAAKFPGLAQAVHQEYEKEITSISNSEEVGESRSRRKALNIDIQEADNVRSNTTPNFSRKLIEEL